MNIYNKDSELIYNTLKGCHRICFNKKERLWLKLNAISFIRDIGFIKKKIYKIYQIPETTHIGKDFSCLAPFLQIGQNTSLNDTYIVAWAPIIIGNNCTFSFRNMIITSTHDINNFSIVIGKSVTIGDNVWITSNVTILQGVTIGNNSIIGAGSVVTNDIPSGVFAAGNPCKVIKEIDFKK
jgi:maltose O-acetyltransferase